MADTAHCKVLLIWEDELRAAGRACSELAAVTRLDEAQGQDIDRGELYARTLQLCMAALSSSTFLDDEFAVALVQKPKSPTRTNLPQASHERGKPDQATALTKPTAKSSSGVAAEGERSAAGVPVGRK